MYWLFGILFIIVFIFGCVQLCRRKKIIRKIKQMDECQKLCLMDEFLRPFGFCYQKQYDIVTSTLTAWQRQFGYCSLYDRTALSFGMVFDCKPIFFYWKGRTWRIELWKGQYGINLGSEIGLYCADGIIKPEDFDKAAFQCASDDELLFLEMALYYKGQKLFEHAGMHWWLTGFCMGKYGKSEELSLQVAITFADRRMLSCFVESLLHTGYRKCDLAIRDLSVCFSFDRSDAKPCGFLRRLRIRIKQRRNRFFCKLFLWGTKPFVCTLDRLLYLYFFLPRVFRRMLCIRKSRRQKFCRCRNKKRKNGCFHHCGQENSNAKKAVH